VRAASFLLGGVRRRNSFRDLECQPSSGDELLPPVAKALVVSRLAIELLAAAWDAPLPCRSPRRERPSPPATHRPSASCPACPAQGPRSPCHRLGQWGFPRALGRRHHRIGHSQAVEADLELSGIRAIVGWHPRAVTALVGAVTAGRTGWAIAGSGAGNAENRRVASRAARSACATRARSSASFRLATGSRNAAGGYDPTRASHPTSTFLPAAACGSSTSAPTVRQG
jgi:hypothetical protein